jgi:hypothetical protein
MQIKDSVRRSSFGVLEDTSKEIWRSIFQLVLVDGNVYVGTGDAVSICLKTNGKRGWVVGMGWKTAAEQVNYMPEKRPIAVAIVWD